MSEYPIISFHNFQAYSESIPSDSTSDDNDDQLEKEQVRLLESEEDREELEKQTYQENHSRSPIHKYVKAGSEAYAYFLPIVSSAFPPFRIPTRSEIKSKLYSWLLALLPSFFLPLLGRSAPRKLHPTSYLDGLRGFAALFVVFDHIKMTYDDQYGSIDLGYHSTPDPSQSSLFIQMPIIRLLYNGQGMVAIFFVVSGYALSYKPLQLIHKRDSAALLDSVAPMIFRRHMRLYLPLIFTTFVAMSLGYFGAFPDPTQAVPIFEGDWKAQAWDWVGGFVEMANPFRPVILEHGYHDAFLYDRNLWTIPVEFRGSLVVFLTLLGLAKVRTAIRMLLITSLVLFCFYYAVWDLFLFLAGSLVADIHFVTSIATPHSYIGEICPPIPSQSPMSFWRLCWQKSKPVLFVVFSLMNLFFALYLVGFNNVNPAETPGYRTLYSWIPQHWASEAFWRRFWSGNGAVYLVLCVSSVKFLQYPFTNPFAQYLGRLSFSLYVVHGTWLHTMGLRMMPHFMSAFGQTTDFGWGSAAWLVVFMASLVWVADLVMRGVDEKCVAFTRWVAKICSVKSGGRGSGPTRSL